MAIKDPCPLGLPGMELQIWGMCSSPPPSSTQSSQRLQGSLSRGSNVLPCWVMYYKEIGHSPEETTRLFGVLIAVPVIRLLATRFVYRIDWGCSRLRKKNSCRGRCFRAPFVGMATGNQGENLHSGKATTKHMASIMRTIVGAKSAHIDSHVHANLSPCCLSSFPERNVHTCL